ncbi:MAG: DUF1570 domain-containing protein [Planctomycetota bacterium]|jgi:hypothetical protein
MAENVPNATSQSRNGRHALGNRARRFAQHAAVVMLFAAGVVAALEPGTAPAQPDSRHDARPGRAAPPHHQRYLALVGRAAGRGLSSDSDAYQAARVLLPDRFVEHQTKRFIVISDAQADWTHDQAHLLERTYHQFHRFTRRLGLRPQPLRHKLVCILFERHEDYQEFAKKHDGVTADWISGYYSPKHDRVVFYNIETNPAVAGAAQLLPAKPAEILAMSPDRRRAGTSDRTRRAETRCPSPGCDLPPGYAPRDRIDEERAKAAIATSVHEAIHQLAFHTRIQSPLIQNPLWISEGLATAFETDRPTESFGPERDFAVRREQFVTLLRDENLIPLRKLVTYMQMPDDRDETITAVYHQSYALVTWISRFRKDELRDYLNVLKNEPPGRPTTRRHLELFEQAFGDVDRLEHKWVRYESERLKRSKPAIRTR